VGGDQDGQDDTHDNQQLAHRDPPGQKPSEKTSGPGLTFHVQRLSLITRSGSGRGRRRLFREYRGSV
jgi:hypothetical protein